LLYGEARSVVHVRLLNALDEVVEDDDDEGYEVVAAS
jgi:hypothetical protein